MFLLTLKQNANFITNLILTEITFYPSYVESVFTIYPAKNIQKSFKSIQNAAS